MRLDEGAREKPRPSLAPGADRETGARDARRRIFRMAYISGGTHPRVHHAPRITRAPRVLPDPIPPAPPRINLRAQHPIRDSPSLDSLLPNPFNRLGGGPAHANASEHTHGHVLERREPHRRVVSTPIRHETHRDSTPKRPSFFAPSADPRGSRHARHFPTRQPLTHRARPDVHSVSKR